jgi:hypothetical protein
VSDPAPTQQEIELARSLRGSLNAERVDVSVRSMAKHFAAQRERILVEVAKLPMYFSRHSDAKAAREFNAATVALFVRRMRGEVP